MFAEKILFKFVPKFIKSSVPSKLKLWLFALPDVQLKSALVVVIFVAFKAVANELHDVASETLKSSIVISPAQLTPLVPVILN